MKTDEWMIADDGVPRPPPGLRCSDCMAERYGAGVEGQVVYHPDFRGHMAFQNWADKGVVVLACQPVHLDLMYIGGKFYCQGIRVDLPPFPQPY